MNLDQATAALDRARGERDRCQDLLRAQGDEGPAGADRRAAVDVATDRLDAALRAFNETLSRDAMRGMYRSTPPVLLS